MDFKKLSLIEEKPKINKGIKKPKVYIDQLYELKKNGIFSDAEIKDEMDTIILGVNNNHFNHFIQYPTGLSNFREMTHRLLLLHI